MFVCFDGGFRLLYPNILRFGWDSYPADYFPYTTNTYLVMDRGEPISDASLVMRDQGNARLEFGLLGDTLESGGYDDWILKTISGPYPTEVFTSRMRTRGRAGTDGIPAGSTDFYGPVLRQFATTGRTSIVIGNLNGLEYPDGKGSGAQFTWNNNTDALEIQAITWNAFYRNISVSVNSLAFHAGPVFLNEYAWVISSQGGVNYGKPVQLADRAFISNGGPAGLAQMHGYTPSATLTAVGGEGEPSTYKILTTLVSAFVSIVAAGTGGTPSPSTTLTVDAAERATSITVASAGAFASGDPIAILQDSGGYHGTTVAGAPVGNVITLATGLLAGASAANVVYKPTIATGTTGTGQGFAQFGVRIGGGGGVTSVLYIATNGIYFTNPSNLSNEPITLSGVTGAALEITMGVRDVERLTEGAVILPPITPVATTSSDAGVGATLDILYQNAIGSSNVREQWENGVRVMPPASIRYIGIGDALTVGVGGAAGTGPGYTFPYNYYLRLPVFNGQHGVFRNIGVSHRTMQAMYDLRATTIAPLFNNLGFLNGAKTVFCLFAGIEDIRGGTTPAALWTLAQTFITYLKAIGGYVLIFTLPSDFGFDTQRDTYNALVQAGWAGAGADRLVDLAADSNIGPDGAYADTDYFASDGIHLTAEGYQVVADLVQDEIDDLVASFTAMSIPTITGSRGGNAALASLLTALANRGILIDSTT